MVADLEAVGVKGLGGMGRPPDMAELDLVQGLISMDDGRELDLEQAVGLLPVDLGPELQTAAAPLQDDVLAQGRTAHLALQPQPGPQRT